MKQADVLSHYRLIERIGEGGMGVVWKAEDTILNRIVAIKVLPPDVSRDEKRRSMFLDEARLAGQVSSAHVVQVHEFGREGELDFIVMEYVAGKPLSQLLHGRPMPSDKVATIGLQVARALSSAHHKDLLHRDLKPANVLVTPDGQVKVADFGLATLFERQPSTEDTTRSAADVTDGPAVNPARNPGGLVGTLHYMSPEQARGEDLDARSDIFSLGIVLYEMTTGRRPFEGSTAVELLREIDKANVTPVHHLMPKVPRDLDRIIRKTLARRRTDRYQTMDDLAVDLKHLARDLDSGSAPSYERIGSEVPPNPRHWTRLALAAGVIAAVGVGSWAFFSRSRGTDDRGLLVLPLEVRGGPADASGYAGFAFAESLVVDLAGATGLKLLPVPQERVTDALALARRERVRRLLTGSLAWEGKELIANVTLIDVDDGRVLWGARRSSDAGLSAVVSGLGPEIRAALGVQSPKRYESFADMKGSQEMSRTEDLAAAVGAFRRDDVPRMLEATSRLVQKFSQEPEAWAIHGYALATRWYRSRAQEDKAALDRALATLDEIALGNPWSAGLRAWCAEAEDPKNAIAVYSQVLARTDISPHLRAWINRRRSWANKLKGELTAAIADAKQAVELDRSDGASYARLSSVLRSNENLEESLTAARQAVLVEPANYNNWNILGLSLGSVKRWDEAAEAAGRACSMGPSAVFCGNYAISLVQAGRTLEAAREAERASKLPPTLYGCYNLACYRALAGDKSGALRDLRRALDLGFADVLIRQDQSLISLHGDAEFEAIVAEVERRLQGR